MNSVRVPSTQNVPQPSQNLSKVTIVMCDNRFDDPASYVAKSTAINALYALRHGYDFVAFHTNRSFCPNEASPTLVACKLKCLAHVMTERPSTTTAVFVDSDAAFNDHSISVEQFLRTQHVTLTSSRTWAAFPTDCDDYFLNSARRLSKLAIWDGRVGFQWDRRVCRSVDGLKKEGEGKRSEEERM